MTTGLQQERTVTPNNSSTTKLNTELQTERHLHPFLLKVAFRAPVFCIQSRLITVQTQACSDNREFKPHVLTKRQIDPVHQVCSGLKSKATGPPLTHRDQHIEFHYCHVQGSTRFFITVFCSTSLFA